MTVRDRIAGFRFKRSAVGAVVLFVVTSTQLHFSPAAGAEAEPVVLAAYQISNHAEERLVPEGNADIMAAKQRHDKEDLGATVYLYIRNPGYGASLEAILWDGKDVSSHAAAPGYQAIWWRLAPQLLGEGEKGEIAICLRRRLKQATEFTVRLTNGREITQRIEPEDPPFRFGTIAFGPDMKKVYLYVEKLRSDAAMPEQIQVSGINVDGAPRWLSPGAVGGVRTAVVTAKSPLRRGKHCTFIAASPSHAAGATLRAFTDLARFGSYGYPGRLEGYAGNGLDGYATFGSPSKQLLDRAEELGIKVAAHINYGAPGDECIGHPALYAYIGMDEPDCQDWGAAKDRPVHLRIGATAMRTLRAAQLHATRDPLTPTLLTVDLTFTPRNYFVYGPIPDIVNPDVYPIALGSSIRSVPQHLTIAKRASAPRTLTYTYQNMWEEWARKDTPTPWMGFTHIRAVEDSTTLADAKRRRGFARAPAPQEVRLEMLYGIGCGVKGLFGYHDGTELSRGGLITHGTWVLPEVWKVNGETIRALRLVAPIIEISHPVRWARSNVEKTWIRTLITGENAALVVAVNEDYESVTEGFTAKVRKDVNFEFPDLPWMTSPTVLKVGDGRFTPLKSQHEEAVLTWTETELADGETYLVLSDPALAEQLENRYRTTPPFATPEGKSRPEDYLRGRRKTPKPTETD